LLFEVLSFDHLKKKNIVLPRCKSQETLNFNCNTILFNA
jgi:hypothetical protein